LTICQPYGLRHPPARPARLPSGFVRRNPGHRDPAGA